jgi:pimeloyl-ACP methyl ester carboxylesterase
MALPARRPDEVRALSRLAFSELRGATGVIEQLHRAIADRSFGSAGPGASPARVAHDTIAAAVYGAVGATWTVAGAGLDRVLAARRRAGGRAVSRSARGTAALGALTGLIGDRLEREGSDLQEPLAIRAHGQPVDCSPASLARTFGDATPEVVIFVHGLMETELSWRRGAGPPYGSRLRADLGMTPVYVRFNSGRHISENGRSLADLLEALVSAWPVEVRRIALVGHSMGGLIARSAAHQASLDGAAWVRRVDHIASLGSPHLGAPLEQGTHLLSAALHRLPETRPLSGFLRRRSAGIRDLRHGSLVDVDWRDADPDALRARAVAEVPLLPGAGHTFVAATVTRSPRHPVGRFVGDLLVLEASAAGRGRSRRIGFDDSDGLHVGGAHHFALLNHPAVYAQLRRWLAPKGR